MRAVFLAVAVSALVLPANADQLSGSITGTYGFYGERCDERGEGRGCNMTFEITGEAAKALYNRMRWKPQPDACTEGVVKDDRSGLRCFKAKDSYTCDFGYSFLQNGMVGSDMEC